MAGGRPKKPAEIALKQGNPGRRNRTALEAAAETTAQTTEQPAKIDDIAPPPAIADDPASLAIWRHIVHNLLARGILKDTDHGVVERYAQNHVLHGHLRTALIDRRTKTGLRLIKKFEREGYGTVEKVRPEWRMLMEIQRELRADEQVLGLSPSSRAALMSRLVTAQQLPPTRPAAANARSVTTNEPSLPPPPDSPVGLLSGQSRKH